MSTFKVPLTTIREIHEHPNADRLSIAKVYDWNVVVQKDKYNVGDKVIYVPVDSILPKELEDKLFPEGSKVKLTKSRIRSIKLRGAISQGMIINPVDVAQNVLTEQLFLEEDYSFVLGITKYEPPEESLPTGLSLRKAKQKKKDNPHFSKYTDIENFKYYDRVIQDGEEVYISEKLHGSSSAFGYLPNEANTLWKSLLKLVNLLPEYEFCWRSRNVQIQNKIFGHKGFKLEEQGVDFSDVYTKMVKQYNLKEIIPKGVSIYGEIVGSGIQKDYTYGCGPGEHKLFVYDIKHDNRWLNVDEMEQMLILINSQAKVKLEQVPVLYKGPFSRAIADQMRTGDSLIGNQKIREGIVIKPIVERISPTLGRVILKYINDDYYLLKDGSDFH